MINTGHAMALHDVNCWTYPKYCKNGLSICFWLRIEIKPDLNGYRHVVSSGGNYSCRNTSTKAGFCIRYRNYFIHSNYHQTTQSFYLATGTELYSITRRINLEDEEWNHICITFKYDTNLKLYHNGHFINNTEILITNKLAEEGKRKIEFGSTNQHKSGSFLIDEFKMWEHELCLSQITSIFHEYS